MAADVNCEFIYFKDYIFPEVKAIYPTCVTDFEKAKNNNVVLSIAMEKGETLKKIAGSYKDRMDCITGINPIANRPEINLISSEDTADMELDDVRLHPNIEKILSDEQWVDDATGLIPHCLAVLKKCHHLTERLVAMMMTNVPQLSYQDLTEIIGIAKKISPRVDDVVRAMYPPLDPRLLEARCIALILSVNHMALVIKSLCQLRTCSWVENALTDMEENIQVLREAGTALETNAVLQKNAVLHTESAITDLTVLSSVIGHNPINTH